jgi:cytochrome c-type biogenesis protein CcmF
VFMIPEYGHFAMVIALCLALLQSSVPLYGAIKSNHSLMALSRSLAAGQFVFVAIALAVLINLFVNDDFSVVIVANGSNSELPILYKFTALWGGHEGSMLLWIFFLTVWGLSVAIFSKQLPLDMLARVLSVMGMIAVGFLLFSLLTSNPFARHLPNFPAEGGDLNPLLQDPGFVIHPPMLYLGSVGFAVAFAFAIAALSSGRLDAAWARWSRPWTNVAWAFLTLGIALGSWWAYYELGWGGWWFWDPVENAPLMPWLVGTALIHSLAATEKRGVFKSWTVLLAIFAFSLSLLGAFLVRSGILTSVHSFAADPDRGMFLLVFLAVTVGSSLTLFAIRAPAIASKVQFGSLSRELLLLVNNVVLLVVMLTVLFGTLFPLIMDAFGFGKYSVGPPYFNTMFVPLMAILIVFMGLGPSAHWKKTSAALLRDRLLVAAIASVVAGALFPAIYGETYRIKAALGVCFAVWIILSAFVSLKDKVRNASSLGAGLARLPRAYYGMIIAHVGFAVSVLGVCLTSQYSVERDLRMEPGQTVELAGYTFHFQGTHAITGPNYKGDEGVLVITQDGQTISTLRPQKRLYNARQDSMMTEADIDNGLMRDIYVALGEPLGDAGAWSVRLYYKPFIRWIWLGCLIMAFGGVLAAVDKRYRLAVRSKSAGTEQTSVDTAAV